MALRSFYGARGSILHVESSSRKHFIVSKSLHWSGSVERRILKQSKQSLHIKASQNASNMTPNAGTSQKTSTASSQKKKLQISPFPNGFQTLVEEVCDQTSVVELELKVGDFEMILKRDIGIPKSSDSAVIGSLVLAPPIPSRPVEEIVSAHTPVVEQKYLTAGSSPFNNISPKLASLEASGQNGYILVSSPTVGSFQRGRTLKGKRQPPSCREGDIIKEGQIVGFLDQLGNLLPVRTNVSGEVFKILYNDGEAVGYGDPLIAVLPYSTA